VEIVPKGTHSQTTQRFILPILGDLNSKISGSAQLMIG
jgi:hypothetical protein